MKLFLMAATLFGLILSAGQVQACDKPLSLCQQDGKGSFGLIRSGVPVSVYVDSQEDPAVIRAAESFVKDLERVSGRPVPQVKTLSDIRGEVIIIGVAGRSRAIDRLVGARKINASDLPGQWEAYKQVVVDAPMANITRALVIVGADRRGAIFGTYDVSEKMGVSPWYWWADVPVEQKRDLYLVAGESRDQPKVRYRGLFINDEDPALKGWATRKFGGVNSGMYEQVFELILRLKGNYIWPAMWGKAFAVDDPENQKLADAMGIVMGTSHHEPMMRAQKEWHLDPDSGVTGGKWDYTKNAANLRAFWRGGMERVMSKPGPGGYESLVTVGMRGDGDEPMSEGTATGLLETIVRDQRQIIADVTGKPANRTPQVWALYKEVLHYYEHGMKVPDDIILLFADDNWGQIRRLPVAGKDDLKRSGGYGVYYHFDYVGAPRNYKWLNTNQIEKVWQQMDLAYQRGARSLWIVNVGDIKPMEYPLSIFMDMAWNPEAMTTSALKDYPHQFAAAAFGEAQAAEIGSILTEYGRLSSRRKPELLDPDTYPLGDGAGPELDGGPFGEIVAEWRALMGRVEAVKATLPAEAQDAYFQLVEHPVTALGNLYELYYAAAWNKRLASRNDARANYFADLVEATYRRDTELTERYHALKDRKWDGMMNQVHMSYVIWNDPTQQSMPSITRVAADTPASKQQVKPVFSNRQVPDSDQIRFDAVAFTRKTGNASVNWQVVANLGHFGGGSVISLPQGAPATSEQDAVRLDYDFKLDCACDVTVSLSLLPTLDTRNSGGVRIGVSVDDGPVQIVSSTLRATGTGAVNDQERAWYKAVTNNLESLDADFSGLTAGAHTLKVWRIDDNVILQQIGIKPHVRTGGQVFPPRRFDPFCFVLTGNGHSWYR